MNWYKKIAQESKWYGEEDIESMLQYLFSNDYNIPTNDFDSFIQKLELLEKLENILASYPPGFKIRKNIDGWSISDPDGNIVSRNEKTLEHAIPGGKPRFDFMGLSIA